MRVHQLIKEVRILFKRWFHKRNIIIVSEKQVRHIPISGGLQFTSLMVLTILFCSLSYSTGGYYAAQDALKEQGKTLRSVTNARVKDAFNPLNKTDEKQKTLEIKESYLPKFTISELEKERMISRVAYLENQVSQLQTANTAIIKRVQEKTDSRINSLKSIIKKTGLKADDVHKKAKKSSPKPNKNSSGGPYIPAEMIQLKKSANELFSDLDKLSELQNIVSGLPVGSPMRGASRRSNYGHRYDPFTNQLAFHSGLDMSGPVGAKIYSTADGIVIKAAYNRSYGNVIDISHGNGVSTRYAHLSKIMVKKGQKVKKGTMIGKQGSTGRSTGPHLHYEVRYNNKAMNPKNFLQIERYVSQIQ